MVCRPTRMADHLYHGQPQLQMQPGCLVYSTQQDKHSKSLPTSCLPLAATLGHALPQHWTRCCVVCLRRTARTLLASQGARAVLNVKLEVRQLCLMMHPATNGHTSPVAQVLHRAKHPNKLTLKFPCAVTVWDFFGVVCSRYAALVYSTKGVCPFGSTVTYLH